MPPLDTETNSTLKIPPRLPRESNFLIRHLSAARIPLLILGHLGIFSLVYWGAFLLRFDFAIDGGAHTCFVQSLPVLLVVKLAVFYAVGHFHGWWRHVTFADLTALFKASTLATFVLVAVDHFVFPFQVSRTVILLDWGMTILTIGALRSLVRATREQTLMSKCRHEMCRALVVGADYPSGRLADIIRSHPEWQTNVVGLVLVNGKENCKRIGTTPVVGTLDNIAEVAAERNACTVLLRSGLASGTDLRNLMDTCASSGLKLKIIPDLQNILEGSTRVPMRDIEINDLLRRDPVELDEASISELIRGKTVMVTGAGGSIGSEICRQIIKYGPHAIVLLGRGENRIYAIDLELRDLKTDTVIEARIASITDQRRMRKVFDTHRPDIVFHAAAHKHVPLMEENVAEAIQNNVLGTKIVADLAAEFGVERFVFISTDKAVNPTSVMGCTKLLGERYVMALAAETDTCVMVTRFGNVLASNGSVVPLFKKQIESGGPITVTDERMTRFFMTIPEASQLVLQAAAVGNDGQIVVLDMGEQIRVIDMARDLIRLSGLPKHAIDIEITGIRPGEKLYEELFSGDEASIPMLHPKLRAAQYQHHSLPEVNREIRELLRPEANSDERLRETIQSILSTYTPSISPNNGLVEPAAVQESNGKAITAGPAHR